MLPNVQEEKCANFNCSSSQRNKGIGRTDTLGTKVRKNENDKSKQQMYWDKILEAKDLTKERRSLDLRETKKKAKT